MSNEKEFPTLIRSGYKGRHLAVREAILTEIKPLAVFDFGCETARLRTILPESISYVGYDIKVRQDEHTPAGTVAYQCNFDKETPRIYKKHRSERDCAVACGLLEWLHGVPSLINFVGVNFASAVITYFPLDSPQPHSVNWRSKQGYVSHHTSKEIRALIEVHYEIVATREWNQQTIFSCRRG